MRKIDLSYSDDLLKDHEIIALKEQVILAHNQIHNKTGLGNELLGWLDYPNTYNKEEFNKVKKIAKKIKNDSDILVVIGIGGSYLGARAVIEAINHTFYNLLPKSKRKYPQILFAGNNLSSNYMNDLIEIMEDKDISINVISKSGTTMETTIAFRILKKFMERKYGKEAYKRIYVTTDKEKGLMKTLADKKGYETFVIPDDIGGRFSVLTSVGLLSMAVSGVNIDELINGAKDALEEYSNQNVFENNSYKYAAIRNIFYRKGKDLEILVNYEPSLQFFSEWWKQLFAESEGKDGKGIMPLSLTYSTDLHSLGQYIQDGKRNLFETIINIEKVRSDIRICEDEDDDKEFEFLNGKSVDYVNKKAFEGTKMAHIKGNVPNVVITIPELNEYYLGKLIYFFQKSCALSGYLLGVNPFDQPGVEEYKRNMIRLIKSAQ
ncbi:glucose-6-phosphate isomerase Pgi [Gottschalkia purinilytica]|uniref:Glucose-6-phosphate isomerase n=1 Tax=Gottschalkia purinilytica TaxID=1503 RepID=A0A0L0W880_GOTPU|nr:glucose-6-phosphate isomerase [Gottschalkia purinilytica]KNF07783.1 glucose-6-phosphate isomerase Pgi [Gottschalkia purinilytica]